MGIVADGPPFAQWDSRVSVLAVADMRSLANERTYLGYLRTAQAFAILGAVTAQVLRLQHSLAPNPVIGFFVVSVPLACVCHGTAIIISTLGALRFFRLQREMARGYAVVGGWEVKCVGALTTLVSPPVMLESP